MNDDEIWNACEYWWDRLNRAYNTKYDIPLVTVTDRKSSMAGICIMERGKLEVMLYEHYIKTVGKAYTETIGHELAHAHNWCHYHRSIKHGYEWKQAMIKIGLEPKRCHNYAPPDRTRITCVCGKTWSIGKIQLKRLITGQKRYICNCKRYLIYRNNQLVFGG